MPEQDDDFMQQALAMAQQGVALGHGGPFGAVVVLEGRIIGRGWNQVVHLNDPTAHAEILAIRNACEHSGSFHLHGATLYTTCEPCPMCMSAAYWARIDKLVYGATAKDAAAIGFDDNWILEELRKPQGNRRMRASQQLQDECRALFKRWQQSDKRIDY
jgi:guanine deaminase